MVPNVYDKGRIEEGWPRRRVRICVPLDARIDAGRLDDFYTNAGNPRSSAVGFVQKQTILEFAHSPDQIEPCPSP